MTERTTRATSGRAVAVGVYGAGLIAWIVLVGVPTDPYLLFGWLWLATIAWDVRAPWRHHLGFVRDWAVVFGLLIVYLYSRGLSDELVSAPVHWTMPVHVDEWLGAGHLPTARLQHAWCGRPCTASSPPRWYDAVLTTVYFSHFVTGLAIAVVLWLRNRTAWVPWMRRYVVINFAALVVYLLYPMAPPWLASKQGYLDEPVARLTGRGWDDLGMGGFHTTLAAVGNPVAAMPSLHAGLAMMVALYAVTRLHTPWRWAVVVYPLLMALALVYDGEHYVVDIAAGWLLAVVVMLGCTLWEGRPPRRRSASSAAPADRGRSVLATDVDDVAGLRRQQHVERSPGDLT